MIEAHRAFFAQRIHHPATTIESTCVARVDPLPPSDAFGYRIQREAETRLYRPCAYQSGQVEAEHSAIEWAASGLLTGIGLDEVEQLAALLFAVRCQGHGSVLTDDIGHGFARTRVVREQGDNCGARRRASFLEHARTAIRLDADTRHAVDEGVALQRSGGVLHKASPVVTCVGGDEAGKIGNDGVGGANVGLDLVTQRNRVEIEIAGLIAERVVPRQHYQHAGERNAERGGDEIEKGRGRVALDFDGWLHHRRGSVRLRHLTRPRRGPDNRPVARCPAGWSADRMPARPARSYRRCR